MPYGLVDRRESHLERRHRMWSRISPASATLVCAVWLLAAGCRHATAPSRGPVRSEPGVPSSRPGDNGRPGEQPGSVGVSEEAVVESRPDPDPREIERFVELYRWSAPPYRMVRQYVPQEAIPRLHKMLRDPQWASCWPAIAFAIGKGSDEPASVAVVLDYITRKEEWHSLEEPALNRRISSKLGVIQWLGRMGGQQAVKTLRAAISREGAAELVKNWCTDAHVLAEMENTPEHIERLVRGQAAVGLVLTRDPENIAAVERERQKSPHPASTMVDAAVYQRVIEERGLDVLLAADATPEGVDLLTPFFKEYFEKNGFMEKK
jgi:hypothetical protein